MKRDSLNKGLELEKKESIVLAFAFDNQCFVRIHLSLSYK